MIANTDTENLTRLKKIDALHDLGIGQMISLPQIVVVGDQSSGKSSVLEGLTGLAFPRDSGLCTRFPTQILFKRSRNAATTATIISGPNSNEERKSKLAQFRKENLQSMDEEEFGKVITEAFHIMSVGTLYKNDETNDELVSFTLDTLKIEIAGPNHEHFSVVDLPGLFRSPKPGITTLSDMTLVREMVTTYIHNERSIIMAVVPANVDIATQEIVQMAREVDPDHQRTLGVLTKPDIVDEGAEDKVMEIVKAHMNGQDLGFSIVCNRSQKNMKHTLDERNLNEEKFFSTMPWNSLPRARVGIENLRQRLSKILSEITEKEFQSVVIELNERHADRERELSAFGPPRNSEAQQRNYLLEIAKEFQDIRKNAINAYYGNDECFRKKPSLRLATKIIDHNEKFRKDVDKHGHIWRFSRRSIEEENNSDSGSSSSKEADEVPVDANQILSASTLVVLPLPAIAREYPELRNIVHQRNLQRHSPLNVFQWIEMRYRMTRGYDIGTFNPTLIPGLFSEQTANWEALGEAYITEVICTLHEFIHDLLFYISHSSVVAKRLWIQLKIDLVKLYTSARKQLKLILEVEREGHLLTTNHYFAENLRKARDERVKRKLSQLQSWTEDGSEKSGPLVGYTDVFKAFCANEENSVQEIHDNLQAYYKVAKKRFVDNVCMQAVDYMLIVGGSSPLLLFSSRYVGEMSSTCLKELAGEDKDTQQRRQELEVQIKALKEGIMLLAS